MLLWWQNNLYLFPNCSNIINIYVTHIRLPDTQMLTIFFVCQPFSQNKVLQVCLYLVFFCCYQLFFMKYSCQLYFTVIVDIVRVTISQVVFGLPAGFCLSAGLFQEFDYFPFQSVNWYLVAIGALNQSFWTYETRLIYVVCHTHPIQTTKIYFKIISG